VLRYVSFLVVLIFVMNAASARARSALVAGSAVGNLASASATSLASWSCSSFRVCAMSILNAGPLPFARLLRTHAIQCATTIDRGLADAVAFGRTFIANPDLPARIRTGAPLNAFDRSTLQ
jgi:hypothetical protein